MSEPVPVPCSPAVVVLPPPSKPWWHSKVLWFNAAALALAAAEAHMQLLRGVVPGEVYQWLAFALPVVNAALRLSTHSAVTLSKAPQRG